MSKVTRRGVIGGALALLLLLAFGGSRLAVHPVSAAGPLAPKLPLPGDQQNPSVASDGSGFLVVWEDRAPDFSEGDIYAARVDADGNTLDPNGIAISTRPELEWEPEVSFDGTNYLVAWTDSTASNRSDVRAARVSPDGEVLDPDGIVLTAQDQLRRIPAAHRVRRHELPRRLPELRLRQRRPRQPRRNDSRPGRVLDHDELLPAETGSLVRRGRIFRHLEHQRRRSGIAGPAQQLCPRPERDPDRGVLRLLPPRLVLRRHELHGHLGRSASRRIDLSDLRRAGRAEWLAARPSSGFRSRRRRSPRRSILVSLRAPRAL